MEADLEKSPTIWALKLKSRTSPIWIDTVLANFDFFLQDHASCERKASGTCLGFVIKCKNEARIVDELTDLAIEELIHFKQVKDLLRAKNLEVGGDGKDVYVNELLKFARNDVQGRLLDRLLIFGIIEARATERFGLIAKHHQDAEMRAFYQRLAVAEARHQAQFVELALEYFTRDDVFLRLEFLLDEEALILERLPVEGRLH